MEFDEETLSAPVIKKITSFFSWDSESVSA